jgi:hypothetical protein
VTRAEDVWSPPRAAATLRFGTITTVPATGFATVTVANGGPVLTGVPVFGGTATVGASVLILHDGTKVVAIVGT